MRIDVTIDPHAVTSYECARVTLNVAGGCSPCVLDIDMTDLLRRGPDFGTPATDFLFLASVVYGADRAIRRKDVANSEDRWTRDLSLVVPLQEPDRWRPVASDIVDSLSFLTGDNWDLDLVQARTTLVRPREQRRSPVRRLGGEAVSLFSGGLDSFIGAVDWLATNQSRHLALVGHYDGDVGGPKSDQLALAKVLGEAFPDRCTADQVRVGLPTGGTETSFRSRSFLFVALGCFYADLLGKSVPLLVPENGPISLNIPLTPSRRGACSTRTTHPHFMNGLRDWLPRVGIDRPILTPYQFKTKGEMVRECRDMAILTRAHAITRSCAKAGHRFHWDNRHAHGCGACVPCLFRRASMHVIGLDTEIYGIDVCRAGKSLDSAGADFHALLAFLNANPSERDVKRLLLSNGPLPIDDLARHASVIMRMRDEVRAWLSAKASRQIKALAGI